MGKRRSRKSSRTKAATTSPRTKIPPRKPYERRSTWARRVYPEIQTTPGRIPRIIRSPKPQPQAIMAPARIPPASKQKSGDQTRIYAQPQKPQRRRRSPAAEQQRPVGPTGTYAIVTKRPAGTYRPAQELAPSAPPARCKERPQAERKQTRSGKGRTSRPYIPWCERKR